MTLPKGFERETDPLLTAMRRTQGICFPLFCDWSNMETKNRRNVLITGSSRGIGFGIAKAFIKNGDCVMINCLADDIRLCEAIDELRHISKTPSRIFGLKADVSDYDACKNLIQFAEEKLGKVDVLINNAGKEHTGLFQDMPPEAVLDVLNANLLPVMYPTQLVLPPMIKAKSGVVVNISSIWGVSGASCEAVYSAAKAGVIGFTKSIAKELGPCGIRVNVIACGAFETRMNEHLSVNEKEMFSDNIPLGRFGQAHEVGTLAVFLASNEASYITGQVINLDGGYV